ncbi:hypothetical protein A2671_02525 [Candidatus Kaiserbacteria bacterium RIFCSPHIGHO2_01_FULL_49_13]|uniref:YbjN domain-containing protein n=1 Tax=Candidatus Kaiserbacteria bacterium RIFCSPHIGHO2_01_FULL_49_13 TaxID=1798477 RepID=A0A1F6CE27_9BACT|nr:MAG: hypothetical protein A2671_02525 [Candidatus Kaiserbacteria bacterium RIFCSPHIGHO2_01_FULL_49_13]
MQDESSLQESLKEVFDALKAQGWEGNDTFVTRDYIWGDNVYRMNIGVSESGKIAFSCIFPLEKAIPPQQTKNFLECAREYCLGRFELVTGISVKYSWDGEVSSRFSAVDLLDAMRDTTEIVLSRCAMCIGGHFVVATDRLDPEEAAYLAFKTAGTA